MGGNLGFKLNGKTLRTRVDSTQCTSHEIQSGKRNNNNIHTPSQNQGKNIHVNGSIHRHNYDRVETSEELVVAT